MPEPERHRPSHYATRRRATAAQSTETHMAGSHVVRAWLTRHVDEASYLPPRRRDEVLSRAGEWGLVLEDGARNPTIDGGYDELIQRALEAGAQEIYVWHHSARDWEPLDSNNGASGPGR